MTFWGNKDMVVNFIRHSFIVCDETSVCESILERPIAKEKPGSVRSFTNTRSRNLSVDDNDEVSDEVGELQHSPDICIDFGHRRRSNTAKRLESLKAERLGQSKIKTVFWKACDVSAEDLRQLFERKEIENTALTPKMKKSLLSAQLEASGTELNVFSDFAKFDGTVNPGCSVKNINVFLVLSKKVFPCTSMPVVALSTARVSDVVGLICYQYTREKRQPRLSEESTRYFLHVAEDNGEVDEDLPPLDSNEVIGKFGFPNLALIETAPIKPSATPNSASRHQQHTSVAQCSPLHRITVNFVNGDHYVHEVSSLDTSLRELRDKVLERRFADTDEPYYKRLLDYNVEKYSEPGKALNLDVTIRSCSCLEFCIVRANSCRKISVADEASHGLSLSPEANELSSPGSAFAPSSFGAVSVLAELGGQGPYNTHQSSPASLLGVGPPCQYFTVLLLHKFRLSIDIDLGIATNRIELIPCAQRSRRLSAARLFSAGPTSHVIVYPIERIGGCELQETKSGGRSVFRIVHQSSSGGDWKSHTCEAQTELVERIIEKLNSILDCRPNSVRLAYKNKAPRHERQLSFYLKRLSLDITPAK